MDDLDLGKTIAGLSAGQKVFSRYTLKRVLGRGGMGVVWRATDESLERDLAIKLLPEIVAADAAGIRELKRETERSQRLSHPHILRTFDFAEAGGLCGITMELVEGGTLTQRRLDQPGEVFEVDTLRPWVKQLCEALAYAHEEGQIVHRDLKPANLMLDQRERLKVADFGISATISDTATRVSRVMGTSGTPVYMSPQQMMGEKPAVTDDIYSLGATLYELLTGKPPFHAGNLIAQVQGKIPANLAARRTEFGISGSAIPMEWEETIAACLAKEAKDRPQSATEVAERLGLVASSTSSRPSSKVIVPSSGKRPPEANVARDAAERKNEPSKSSNGKSFFLMLVAAVIIMAGGGYYLGVYGPEQRKVELARLEAQRKEAERLATARGGMIIRTEPAGAEVRVGGVGIETSPATLKEMRLGVYEVTLSKPGYETQVLKLGVEENRFTEPTAIALKPSVGSAVLSSEPVGLDYELMSTRLVAPELSAVKRSGKTPATLNDLPLGEYIVTTQRAGWPEKRSEFKVERGAEGKLAVDFVGGALTMTSTPEGVDYEVVPGRGVTEGTKYARMSGKLPANLNDLPPGEYTVVTRWEGWPEKRGEVKVERGAEGKLAVDFQGGSMALTSNPAGLEYEVISMPGVTAGKKYARIAGTTPAVLVDFPPGDYTVITRKEGWPEKSERVKIERGIEGKRTVDFAGGGLTITSAPAGLEYEVVAGQGVTKGKKYARIEGKTPATLSDLPIGGYTVIVKRGAWTVEQQQMQLAAGETATMTVQMEGGGLKIESEPSGVDWKIVDAPTRAALEVASGRTPANLKEIPPGRYVIELQRSGGWVEQQKIMNVKVGETAIAAAEFASGAIVITSTPSGAEVYGAGKKIGVTPLNLDSLPPIYFEFELRLQGYKSANVRVEVRAKETVRANATLEEAYFTIQDLNLKMVKITPGTFTMGSENGSVDEKPATRVTITRPYWLGATEVTQEQYKAFMGYNPSNFKGDNLPVENVTWAEAMEFARKLTARERAAGRLPASYVYTLPTEAQWEYGCRAGTTGDYAGILAAIGWYDQNSGSTTHAVGAKQANDWGLFDMHGNVYEWCADWYADKLPGGSATDPRGSTSGSYRVFRGGGWGVSASGCRAAFRNRDGPGLRNYDLGFRLALSSVP